MLLLMNAYPSYAQVRDRAYLWHQPMSSDSGELSIAEGWVSERWFLDEEGSKLLQFGVQTRRTEISETGIENDLWIIAPQINYLQTLNERYSLIVNIKAGLFSDLQRVTSEDFRPEGAVILDRYVSEMFTWGLGAGRVSNFGRVIFVPLLHIVWSISPKWMLDAVLPGKLDLLYLPNSKLETGLSFNIIGSRFSIESEVQRVDSIGVAQMNLGPVIRYQVLPSLYLSAEAGLAFARRLSLMDQNTEVATFTPHNEGYLRTGLQYRF